MRRVSRFLLDVLLVLMATFAALVLRDNFEVSVERLAVIAPYFAASAVMAAVVIPAAALDRSIWRFSALPDFLRVVGAVIAIVVGAVILSFSWNRLDGVARSLPIMQAILGIAALIWARIISRLHHAARQERKRAIAPLKVVENSPADVVQTVLVVGLSRLTETYLQSIAELAPGRVRVAGLLGRSDRHVGRLVGTHAVLGVPEDVESVIADLELHGVFVDRIVVTARFASLPPEAREALLHVEQAGAIELRFLSEDLGFESSAQTRTSESERSRSPSDPELSFEIAPAELAEMAGRRYWRIKRAIDIVGAGVLIVLALAAVVVIAPLVALSIGFPLIFWQQRPGLGGRPFRLYKFRTMAAAHAADGRRLSDAERTSAVGDVLRRTRLDELPQLFSILRGDMSFVGPRPLLPRDQSEASRSRLLVRPGLTGWAQVVGGRAISAEDKAALDVWYVYNASLMLDLEIVARTVPMVLFGEQTEQTYKALVATAWHDLRAAGICRGEITGAIEQRLSRVA